MNDKKLIKHLFKKLLDNSISEEELDELLKYAHKSDQDRVIKELMNNHWDEINVHLKGQDSGIHTDERFKDILRKVGRGQVSMERKKEGVNRTNKNSIQWIIGIAASICILISLGIYWSMNTKKNSELPITGQVASVNFSGKQVVHLPDGSKVILNEGSQLTYDEMFDQETREVVFSGEGYFDIAHDSEKPFIVHTDKVRTTVLGTAFNLTAYENQTDVVVTVARGKVAVGDDQRIFDNILPKQQMVVNKQTRNFDKEEVDLEEVLAWKEKFLIMDEMTIKQVVELIGSRHHVEIAIANNKIVNCKISAAFMKGESLEQILRVVCGVLQAEFTIDGDKVFIKGGRDCE